MCSMFQNLFFVGKSTQNGPIFEFKEDMLMSLF
jgi:hypothetical protein